MSVDTHWLTPAVLSVVFYKLAAYGHMGRMDMGLRWELTDKTQAFKIAVEF